MKKEIALKAKQNLVFLVVTAILVLFIATCITLTVKGSENGYESGYNEEYYDLLEERYKEEVTDILEEYGLYRSGVNLTKITLGDGSREYTLVVYNGKLSGMESARLEALTSELCAVGFPDAACSVRVSLEEM